jgi:PAS domain S-box-containing protein
MIRERIYPYKEAADIAEKKGTLEPEFAEEQALLRALLEHASDGIYFKDKDCHYRRCSRAKIKRHGTTDQEIVGKTDFDFFSDSHAQAAFKDEQEIIRTGQPILGKVEHELMKNGDELWCLSSKWPLRNGQGEIIGTFGISKDITALKQAEAKLDQVHKELLDASRAAGMAEMASTVLHNVGNVLNSVNISASVMADKLHNSRVVNLGKAAAMLQAHAGDLAAFLGEDDKGRQLPAYLASLAEYLAVDENKLREELASLCANIDHIKDIISTQQSYARFAGIQELLPAADLFEDALRLNAGAFERHNIEVIRDFAPVPPLMVEKHKVLQILVNLLRNAKYALDGGRDQGKRLILSIGSGGPGMVKFIVIDNGVGIPPENLARVFEHGFTTRKAGHGFGLHSGSQTAQQLGGSLTCQSGGPGKGATFILELPLSPKAS